MPTTPNTSPFAPDVGAVRAWMEEMVRTLRFAELVVAVVAFIARMCEINRELTKKLAELRTKRPRSETLERLQRQLSLPFGALSATKAPGDAPAAQTEAAQPRRSRKGRHPGRAAFPAWLPRVEVKNPVPPELRICGVCGAEMTTVDHSRCEVLNVIPARVVVEVRWQRRELGEGRE